MQKQTQPTNVTSGMSVSILRFGHPANTLNVPVGSTVADVLAAANLTTAENEEMFVEGEQATGQDILEDGDVLSIVTRKQAG